MRREACLPRQQCEYRAGLGFIQSQDGNFERLAGWLTIGSRGSNRQIKGLTRDNNGLAGLGSDAEAKSCKGDGLGGGHVLPIQRGDESERAAGAHSAGVESQLRLALSVGGDRLRPPIRQCAAQHPFAERFAPIECRLQRGLDGFAPEPDASRKFHREFDLLQLECADFKGTLEMQRLQSLGVLMRGNDILSNGSGFRQRK